MPFRKPARHVDRVFLHCSASDDPDHDDIETIRRWHVDERGWSDVGYHYFIRSDGTLQEGRPLERIPAAQAGHNAGHRRDLPARAGGRELHGRPAPHPDRPRPRDRRGLFRPRHVPRPLRGVAEILPGVSLSRGAGAGRRRAG